MALKLLFSTEAKAQLRDLEHDPRTKDLVKLKRVRRCLGLLEANPRHPGLNSHKYAELKGPNGEDVWESYVENRTPSAWRVFWHYGPGKDTVTVVSITPHP
ncbi:MAG: hypothetical protein H3C58_06485 [Fimbriimonadaceae bacterium]|nr:hypothetical protein [Fimbriimonadaceae bacterium]